MKCPNCGKEITSESKFCEYCGCKINSTKKRQNKLWIICICLLCIGTITVCLYKQYEASQIALSNTKGCAEEDMFGAAEVEKQAKREYLRLQGYMDLGLPSGTLWKIKNEDGFYTYEQAVEKFGNSLPTKEQFEELIKYGEWQVSSTNCAVAGPNGVALVFPCPGYLSCDGASDMIYGENQVGSYWSSTIGNSPEYAWRLDLYTSNNYPEEKMVMVEYYKCFRFCVRLVTIP